MKKLVLTNKLIDRHIRLIWNARLNKDVQVMSFYFFHVIQSLSRLCIHYISTVQNNNFTWIWKKLVTLLVDHIYQWWHICWNDFCQETSSLQAKKAQFFQSLLILSVSSNSYSSALDTGPLPWPRTQGKFGVSLIWFAAT